MTTMTMPAMTNNWSKVKALLDSLGLTIVDRIKTNLQWTIILQEDLTSSQKTQLETRILHTISGIDWS